jgi:hypothetical protein
MEYPSMEQHASEHVVFGLDYYSPDVQLNNSMGAMVRQPKSNTKVTPL